MKRLVCAYLWLLVGTASAQTLSFDCRVQYQKDGELWHRAVALEYDQKKLVSVKIDGQPVHRFNLVRTTIVTSIDSERIRLEFEKNKTTWRSNFRDIDLGSGVCIKVK